MNTLKIVSGIFLGPLLAIGLLFWFLHLKRGQRKRRKERPPQKTKLLRPAGYSLQCCLEVLEETFTQTLILVSLGAALFGIALVGLVPLAMALALRELTLAEAMRPPLVYGWMSGSALLIAGLAFAFAQSIRVNRQLTEIRDRRFGLRGEQAVAEALASTVTAAAG